MVAFSKFATTAGLIASVSAHAIWQELYVNGVDQGHLTGIRVPTYDGPIQDVTSDDLICNGGINPYNLPLPTNIITIPAGASVTAEMHHTLAGADPSDPADPIDPSHKGPITFYLASIDNALDMTVTGLSWFKIWEDGLHADGTWAVDTMIAQKGKMTFTIPSCVPSGNYLLRMEAIALHAASSYPGAQFYMECGQINITGGGSASPSGVAFPGAYHSTDPGIVIDIYYPTPTTYIIPGPTVFTCPGGSGPAPTTSSAAAPPTTTLITTTKATTTSTTPSKAATTTSSTTTAAKPTTTSSTTTSSKTTTAITTTTTSAGGGGGSVGAWGQCGGIGWTGGTVCTSGYTCSVGNPYYSQCIPS